jgi:glucose/arabinose dehydrogenase
MRATLTVATLCVAALLILAGVRSALPERVASAAPRPPPRELAALVRLELLTRAAEKPVDLTYAPGDAQGRLFVVEKTGRVRILRKAAAGFELAPEPFLDLSRRVSRRDEQGLLGLAFHPRFAENGRLVVNLTDTRGDTRVLELRISKDDPNRADVSSERELLFVDQPYENHNGGAVVFGPDGKLYVGLGDGGSRGDPLGHGQNRSTLLGKMLRLDLDGPPGPDGRPIPEIVHLGLRNPWRYSFDRGTGDLYIADVGQDRYEEVNVLPASALGQRNFGWNLVEGIGHAYKPRGVDQGGLTQPVLEYGHRDGCSITGGFVYRGKAIPELSGVYFYADYCTGLLRSFRFKDGQATESYDWKQSLDPEGKLATLSSFGVDASGELYLLSLDGPIYKFVRAE